MIFEVESVMADYGDKGWFMQSTPGRETFHGITPLTSTERAAEQNRRNESPFDNRLRGNYPKPEDKITV